MLLEMKKLLFLMFFVPLFSIAQKKGISFLEQSSWQDVLVRAKAENRYIFVDCYTTWCGPCKMMDRDVYVNDSVGQFMNSNFIAVKLQMDSTAQDKDEVRKWYGIANGFERRFHINAYPSYLFFLPNGQIAHKDVGRRGVSDFLKMAAAALDTNQQYYTLLFHYKTADVSYTAKASLALQAQQLGLDSIGRQIAKDILGNYLDTLSENKLWTKENVELFNAYLPLVNAEGRLFRLFYKDRLSIDTVMNRRGYSIRPIMYLICNKEIRPFIEIADKNKVEPDWKSARQSIRDKYTAFEVEKDILYCQTNYYYDKKDWKQYATYCMKSCEQDRYRFYHDANFLNNYAFEVFEFSKSKRQLRKVLRWVNRALEIDSNNSDILDTKANLLYKLGNSAEALIVEQRSLSLKPEDKELQQNFEKMREGQPTWKLY